MASAELLDNCHSLLPLIEIWSNCNVLIWDIYILFQDVEAVLFVFSSVSESVPTDEATHIPKLFSVLSAIQFVNSQQISTALNMIGM